MTASTNGAKTPLASLPAGGTRAILPCGPSRTRGWDGYCLPTPGPCYRRVMVHGHQERRACWRCSSARFGDLQRSLGRYLPLGGIDDPIGDQKNARWSYGRRRTPSRHRPSASQGEPRTPPGRPPRRRLSTPTTVHERRASPGFEDLALSKLVAFAKGPACRSRTLLYVERATEAPVKVRRGESRDAA